MQNMNLKYQCKVSQISSLNEKMFHIFLDFEAPCPDFDAGQYLLLHLDIDGQTQALPYSIANAPTSLTGQNQQQVELYIANTGELSQKVITELKQTSHVNIQMPFGDCIINQQWLAEHENTALLMVASGSGFSQIKSLNEAIFALAPQQEVHIYWSNKAAEDFYLTELNQQWEKAHPNCHYHPILESGREGWRGKSGFIFEVIQRDFKDLSKIQMFMCGSPNMVYGTLDKLAHLGLSEKNTHSDVFAYAPR